MTCLKCVDKFEVTQKLIKFKKTSKPDHSIFMLYMYVEKTHPNLIQKHFTLNLIIFFKCFAAGSPNTRVLT